MLIASRLSQERTLILTFPYCFELRVYRYPADTAPSLPHQAARQSVNGRLTPEHWDDLAHHDLGLYVSLCYRQLNDSVRLVSMALYYPEPTTVDGEPQYDEELLTWLDHYFAFALVHGLARPQALSLASLVRFRERLLDLQSAHSDLYWETTEECTDYADGSYRYSVLFDRRMGPGCCLQGEWLPGQSAALLDYLHLRHCADRRVVTERILAEVPGHDAYAQYLQPGVYYLPYWHLLPEPKPEALEPVVHRRARQVVAAVVDYLADEPSSD